MKISTTRTWSSRQARPSRLGTGACRRTAGKHEESGGRRRKTAADINDDFLDWLSKQEKDRPFFVFLNYFDAHSPYLLPEGYDRHFGKRVETLDERALLEDWENRPKQNLSESDTTLVTDAYDDCIGYLDSQIGKLMDELAKRGVLENTLIVITSDHGEDLGEHGLFGHGRSLYSQEIHVPLVILAPAPAGSGSGRVVAEPVSLRDLPATFVDVLGLAHESPFPGKSLAGYWKSGTDSNGTPTRLRTPRWRCDRRCRRIPIALRPGEDPCSRLSPLARPSSAMPMGGRSSMTS